MVPGQKLPLRLPFSPLFLSFPATYFFGGGVFAVWHFQQISEGLNIPPSSIWMPTGTERSRAWRPSPGPLGEKIMPCALNIRSEVSLASFCSACLFAFRPDFSPHLADAIMTPAVGSAVEFWRSRHGTLSPHRRIIFTRNCVTLTCFLSKRSPACGFHPSAESEVLRLRFPSECCHRPESCVNGVQAIETVHIIFIPRKTRRYSYNEAVTVVANNQSFLILVVFPNCDVETPVFEFGVGCVLQSSLFLLAIVWVKYLNSFEHFPRDESDTDCILIS